MGLLSFTYKDKEFLYVDKPHNATRDNERGVELALAKLFMDQYPDLTEIGAVTPYYYPATHEVIDLTDPHPRAKNIDASGMDVKERNILAISTVEHFGKGRAIPFIEDVILHAHKYLITFPLGYNDELDNYKSPHIRYISRIDPKSIEDIRKDNWIEKDILSEVDRKYGTYQWANTIAVIENFV